MPKTDVPDNFVLVCELQDIRRHMSDRRAMELMDDLLKRMQAPCQAKSPMIPNN